MLQRGPTAHRFAQPAIEIRCATRCPAALLALTFSLRPFGRGAFTCLLARHGRCQKLLHGAPATTRA
jgi:hypothetical protein